ncbi:MAG TPA: dihydroorotase [Stellaceae bacterium]|nr:dihydroorotase [Stellaceae bacterium]
MNSNAPNSNAMNSILFTNARLVDPWTHRDEISSLLVSDGVIAGFGEDAVKTAPAECQRIDATGLCLAPGLVDMRVHLREPGHEHVETLEEIAKAAASGGVTSVVGLPNTDPVVDDASLVDFVTRRARRTGLVRLHTYGAVTHGLAGKNITEMGLLAQAGALGFTDGVKPVASAMVMRRALSYARTFDQLVMQHPEEPKLADGGAATEGEMATRMGLPGIPEVAELMMLERDLRLVELTGGRYHAAHISTAGAVEAIRQAKAKGLPVTCDTTPPYFTLNETAIDGYSTHAKLSPPLRSETHRRAVLQGLADGTIDAIASDHAAVDEDEKRVPFTSATPGAVGLETLLPLSLGLYHRGEMPLQLVLRALTQGPADILRLPVGRLSLGAIADLVLFDLDRPWRIDAGQFHSGATNTPFHGLPVQGKVVATFVGGRQTYSETAHSDA